MRTKLIAAFLFITILVVAIISGFIFFYSEVSFQEYLEAKQTNRVVQWLAFFENYYVEYGGFDELELLMPNEFVRGNPQQNRPSMGQQRGSGKDRILIQSERKEQVLIADQERVVLFDSDGVELGKLVDEREFNKGYPIVVDEEKVGMLLLRDPIISTVNSLEEQFVKSMNQAIVYASLVTVFFACLVGFLLSKQISKRLLLLREGVRLVTEKNYSHRLSIDSRDEIGDLAKAFNEMVSKIQYDEKVKNQLITDVAHELRTPLTTLRGKLEMMQNSSEVIDQKEILILNDEVLRLSKLINDLQDVSMLQDNRLPMNMAIVSVHSVLEHVTSLFSWELDEKEINLKMNLQATEDEIIGDRNRLIQVFINLISNGIRYLDKDEKNIVINSYNKDETIVVEIADNGKGIDEDNAGIVFERFYRGDPSRARSSGGTGLGLAIVKGIIEAHQGSVHVTSTVDEGTVFSISFRAVRQSGKV